MTKTVLGVFKDERVAEEAVHDLRNAGFEKEISVLAKEKEEEIENTNYEVGDSVSDGTTTGGVLGGLAGLAAGAGALVIPGIGPLVAAGPISGLLGGAATGGIAGGLIDWGVPEQESEQIETDIKQGKILVALNSSEENADEAQNILRDHGAENIKVHDRE